jgi:hypothetical protein
MADTKYRNTKVYRLQRLSNYYKNPVSLEKQKDTISGDYAWLVLATSIAAYDIYAIKSKKAETLTKAFWRFTEKPSTSVVAYAAWGVLTAHLLAEKKIRKNIWKDKDLEK